MTNSSSPPKPVGTCGLGPYGDLGSRKYLVASLDQSLRRLGVDYVDIFYHHHFDSETPLEESLGALQTAVTSGKALYVGISSYSDKRTTEAVAILRELGTPLLIHQPSYSMFNRWIEDRLLDVLGTEGVGCIAFSVLAQGLLTDHYVNGIPPGSRADRGGSLRADMLNDENLSRIRGLNDIASGRGQSLAQMAIAWALRDARVTSALIGSSTVAQLEQNVGALERLEFTPQDCRHRPVRRRRRRRLVARASHILRSFLRALACQRLSPQRVLQCFGRGGVLSLEQNAGTD